MRVTIDTNVIYQALYSDKGASYRIFNMVRNDRIELALSVPVFEEYCDVLQRPSTIESTGLSRFEISSILDFIAYVGLRTHIYYTFRPNLSDEDDNMFIELAFISSSEYLITGNIRDYTLYNELKFGSFKIVTPNEFLKIWRIRNE